jgi:hypothetical protein
VVDFVEEFFVLAAVLAEVGEPVQGAVKSFGEFSLV